MYQVIVFTVYSSSPYHTLWTPLTCVCENMQQLYLPSLLPLVAITHKAAWALDWISNEEENGLKGLEVLSKTARMLNNDNSYPAQESYPRSPKYKTDMLTTKPQC